MSYGNFTLKVVAKKEIAPNILLVTTNADGAENFLAGQYFSFKIADKINRSYSIASAPHSRDIEFLVDITPGGPGSKFVDWLREHDTFSTLGPFGFFTLEKTLKDTGKPLIFIATGSGIAPFRSMVFDLLKNKKHTGPISLYFGLRHDTQAYFFDDFRNLEQEYSNFSFVPVISRPSAEWKGDVGYCQEVLRKYHVFDDAQLYICGRNENVASITNALIEHGYAREHIFFEKFG